MYLPPLSFYFNSKKKSTKNSKKLKISKTVNFTKKVHGTKKMQNLISHQTCSIKFSVSSTILLILQKIRFLGGHLVNSNMAATGICANANIDFLSPQTIPFPKIYSFANLQIFFTQNIRGWTIRPSWGIGRMLQRGEGRQMKGAGSAGVVG